MPKNTKLSGQDHKGKDLSRQPKADFKGRIEGAKFGHKQRGKKVWPDGLKGCRFHDCEFENTDPPPKSTLTGQCAVLHRAPQVDGQEWLVDSMGKPIRPVDVDLFRSRGWSLDPNDIGGVR